MIPYTCLASFVYVLPISSSGPKLVYGPSSRPRDCAGHLWDCKGWGNNRVVTADFLKQNITAPTFLTMDQARPRVPEQCRSNVVRMHCFQFVFSTRLDSSLLLVFRFTIARLFLRAWAYSISPPATVGIPA